MSGTKLEHECLDTVTIVRTDVCVLWNIKHATARWSEFEQNLLRGQYS